MKILLKSISLFIFSILLCKEGFSQSIVYDMHTSAPNNTICRNEPFILYMTPSQTIRYVFEFSTDGGVSWQPYTNLSSDVAAYTEVAQSITLVTSTKFRVFYTTNTTVGSSPDTRDPTIIDVTVNQLPAITPILSTTNIVCQNSSITYSDATPSGVWSSSNISIATVDASTGIVTGVSQGNAIIRYIITDPNTGCKSQEAKPVTVNPTPIISSYNASVCSGAIYSVTPSGIVPAGTTFNWAMPTNNGTQVGDLTGMAAAGTSTQPNVNALLTNNTNAVLAATYSITATKGACSGVPFTLDLSVTPKPIINNRIVQACSGANFRDEPSNGGGNIVPAGITYSWDIPSVPSGITNQSASGTPTPTVFGGTLINSTTSSITVYYTINTYNANCSGTTYTTTVHVNPTPNIIAESVTTCSNSRFEVNFNNGSNLIPTSTTYTWSAPSSVAGINGLQSGTSQSVVSGTLSNTTNATISNIIYNIRPTSGTLQTGYCSGPAFVVNVTVHPLPVIASVGPTQTGSGSNFNFPLGLQPSDVVPIGTTYFWGSPSVQSGITGGAASGVATQTSLVGSLTNLTGTFLDAIYTIIPSYENCAGSQFTFTVRVYPKPIIGPKNAPICSGQSFTITLTDGANGDVIPNGTTYSWSAPVVTGIVGTASATAAGTISGTLTNSTNNPITVLYIVTPFANPQSGDPFNVSVTVNPLPIASISISENSGLVANDRIICEDINANFTAVPVVGALTDYSYVWTVPPRATPQGNVSSFGSNIAGTYGLQLTNINTRCASAAQTTTSLTVNQNPTVGPIIGVNNVCVNSTISLSSSNVSGGSGGYNYYYWNDNNNLVAPITSTSVNFTSAIAGNALLTYKVRDDLGCFSAMSSPVFELRVNALPLAPTAVSINQIYDGLLHTGSAIANNPAAEQINWFLNSTGAATSTAPSATNVGTPVIRYANAQNTTTGCISATRTAVSVTIIQKGLIITANDFTKIYDGIAYTGGNGVRYDGFVNNETPSVLNGTLSYTGTAQNAINAGNYLIQPSGLSANNYNVSLVAGNLVINPKGLTITGAAVQDKIYDATDRATLFAGTLVGVIAADLPNIQLNRSARFSSKNVGANLVITSTSTITGVAAPNYVLDPTINVTATITPKRIEAIGVVTANKIYDGTVVTTVTGGGFNTPIAPGTGNSNDKLPYVADQIQLVPSGIFTSKDVGNAISITSTSSILGLDKDNYVLDQPILTPRNITAKTLTMFGLSVAAPKIYDATQTAIVSGTPSLGVSQAPGTGTVLDGLPYNNDILTITGNVLGTYNTKDVRTANSVTFSGLSLSGLNANNYILAIQPAVASTILPKKLNMFGLNIPSSKVYDGNTNATVSGMPSLFAPENGGQGNGSDGIPYIGDDVSISGTPIGNYNSSQVVSASDVQFSGLSLTGNQSSNYYLVIQENKAATITPLAIQVNATAKTKTFRDIDPVFTYTNDPLIGNDLFSGILIRTAGEDVGSYPILIGTLTLSPNYTILFTSNVLRILPSNLIIKPNPIIRTYGDAPLPTTIVTSNFQVTGLRNNETIKSLIITLPTGLETGNGFKDPVGIYKNVIETSNLVTETAELSNYTVVLLPTDIEVIQYAIVIKAEPKKKRKTQIDPPLTYALSRPLIQGDSIIGSLFRIPGEDVGFYNIKIGTLEINDNYAITYEPDFLEILTIERVIVVPNVFTPNNDGLNDQLKVIHNSTVVGLNYFKVFNRAGNQVFETRDLSQGWDGRVGGNIGDADAYYWILEYTTWDNKSFKLNGSTLLIK